MRRTNERASERDKRKTTFDGVLRELKVTFARRKVPREERRKNEKKAIKISDILAT